MSLHTHLLYTVLSTTDEFLTIEDLISQSQEAVLLCLALFFLGCSAYDERTNMNHGLSQLEKKTLWQFDGDNFYMKNRHDVNCICSDSAV